MSSHFVLVTEMSEGRQQNWDLTPKYCGIQHMSGRLNRLSGRFLVQASLKYDAVINKDWTIEEV